MKQTTLAQSAMNSRSILAKMMAICLIVAAFFTATAFRPMFGTLTYGGGSGPQIVATYDGYAITVASGTPGPVRIDYTVDGWLYRSTITPGTPFPIPTNTSYLYLSNSASTSYYTIN